MREDAALIVRLRAIVMQLPLLQREVFLLHCVQELEYQAIASRLDITIDVVQLALAQALSRIDRELEDTWHSN